MTQLEERLLELGVSEEEIIYLICDFLEKEALNYIEAIKCVDEQTK